jgi:TRAP-type mannitol/chloroaromatic compound transport system substrate-binding protein
MHRRKFLHRAATGGVATGLLSTGLAAPAIAQERRDMTIVSTWPRDMPGLGLSAQRLADRITELSEGRIVTQYFAAGEKVGALDVFDDVASGNSNAYVGADYYWKGKHPGLAYFTAVPFGMTYAEHTAWMKFQGGNELMNELKADFGMWGVLCGNTGCQMGGWFNKEIDTADDLKGLKMRIPGLGGDVLTKLGVSTVSLPGGEIYQNLVSGTIDATEWVGPYNDYFMKLYEAAKYYYYPGMHEPGAALTLTMNASWWGELSDWEKEVVIAASYEEHATSMDEANAFNGEYLQKMITENGIELREFSDEVYEAFGEASLAVFEETRAHSEMATRIDDSFQKSLREIGYYMKISDISYSNKRNLALDI